MNNLVQVNGPRLFLKTFVLMERAVSREAFSSANYLKLIHSSYLFYLSGSQDFKTGLKISLVLQVFPPCVVYFKTTQYLVLQIKRAGVTVKKKLFGHYY